MTVNKEPPKAGHYVAWDGKAGGKGTGGSGKTARTSSSWSSVKSKQAGKTFTAEEVRGLIKETLLALQNGGDIDEVIGEIIPEEKTILDEEFVVSGR